MDQPKPQSPVSPDSSATSHQETPAPRGFRRCQARNRSGSRCRRLCNPATGRCDLHPRAPLDGPEDMDLSAHFGDCLDNLESASNLHTMMAILAKLVIKNEISTRRAAVLAYITSQLLRTLDAIDKEPAQIIFDLPPPSPSLGTRQRVPLRTSEPRPKGRRRASAS